MCPDDRQPLRVCGSDGFCWSRTESLRDALGAHVVGRDQRDKPGDRSRLVGPVPDRRSGLGRVPVSPVRPDQGPAQLGLGMTSRACEIRGRPAAPGEDHETCLADKVLAALLGSEDERTELIGSPTSDPLLDHGSGIRDGRHGLSVQPSHYLVVGEQLEEVFCILRCPGTETEPVREEAHRLPGVVTSHADTLLRSTGPVFRNDPERVGVPRSALWFRSPVRMPDDLPEVAIRIAEVAGVDPPWSVVGGRDASARGLGLFQ
jgi:hypothetical protein